MPSSHIAAPRVGSEEIPAVPLTIEGYSVLHQMMRVRWSEWRQVPAADKRKIVDEAVGVLSKMEQNSEGQSAVFSLLGHKGDLMFVHFRNSFVLLNQAELELAQLALSDYLEPTTSYLSVIELGLYESTIKVYRDLKERGIEPTPTNGSAKSATLWHDRKRRCIRDCFPRCLHIATSAFYPMDRRRGEDKNWYTLPIEERARQMNEHGMVGRRYAGEVRQIITGSIGFDDWEWGVDLFADDPLVFKKLIYEMRFDQVSAVYALFGTFLFGRALSGGRPGQASNRRSIARRSEQALRRSRRTLSIYSIANSWSINGDTWPDRIQRREPGSACGLRRHHVDSQD